MYPSADPTSQIGQLSSSIDRLERQLHSKADDHEISSIRSELSSCKSDLRTLTDKVDRIESTLDSIKSYLCEASSRLW